MLKIKKLILENFQSHKYSELVFDPGLNTILGPTDSGKTAIFRAIRWALYNEPSGDYFIREGQREVSVSVEFTDGTTIKRYRTPSKNGYELIQNGESQIFEGFGTTVPEEITKASKMPKININDKEDRSVNMAEQLEGPFLLSDSSSTKAGAIGKLVQADVIDRALADTNLDLRRKKTENNRLIEEIEIKNQALKDYEYLDQLGKTIDKLDKKIKEADEKKDKLSDLQTIKEKYDFLKGKKEEYLIILGQMKNLDFLENYILKLENKSRTLKELERLKVKSESIVSAIKINRDMLRKLANQDKTEEIYLLLNKKTRELKKLDHLNKNKNILQGRIKTGRETLKKLEGLDEINEKTSQASSKISRYFQLSEININLKNKENRIKGGRETLESLRPLNEISNMEKLAREKLDKLASLNKLNIKFKENQASKNNEEKIYKDSSNKITGFIKTYESILMDRKICPTCFRPMDEDDQKLIKENLE